RFSRDWSTDVCSSDLAAHRQRLDAGIFDQIDQRDLERFKLADGKAGTSDRKMRLSMGGRGTEQRARRIVLHTTIDLRQPDEGARSVERRVGKEARCRG